MYIYSDCTPSKYIVIFVCVEFEFFVQKWVSLCFEILMWSRLVHDSDIKF